MQRSQSMFIQLVLMTLICLCFGQSPSAFAQESCKSIYTQNLVSHTPDWPIKVVRGRYHDDPVPFEIPPGANVLFLGRGQMGGEVYRVVYVDKTAKIFKDYKQSIDARLDLFRMDLIRKALDKNPKGEAPAFQVTSAKRVSDKVLELGDTRGTSLEAELANPWAPPEIKKFLTDKYDACTKNLFTRLKERFPDVTMSGRGLFVLKKSELDMWRLMIHKGNVIVTPNYDLVIIDPY